MSLTNVALLQVLKEIRLFRELFNSRLPSLTGPGSVCAGLNLHLFFSLWRGLAPSDFLPVKPVCLTADRPAGESDMCFFTVCWWDPSTGFMTSAPLNASSCCSLVLKRGSWEQRGWATNKQFESKEQMFHVKDKHVSFLRKRLSICHFYSVCEAKMLK